MLVSGQLGDQSGRPCPVRAFPPRSRVQCKSHRARWGPLRTPTSPKRSEARQSRAARQGRGKGAAKRCLLTAA